MPCLTVIWRAGGSLGRWAVEDGGQRWHCYQRVEGGIALVLGSLSGRFARRLPTDRCAPPAPSTEQKPQPRSFPESHHVLLWDMQTHMGLQNLEEGEAVL